MAARPIADPIHLFDCVMPCAGAEAFLVMSEERARDLGLPYAHVLGTIERHNAFADDPIKFRGGWAIDLRRAVRAGRLPAADIDFVQTYDDYPVILMMQLEGPGLLRQGRGRRPSCASTTFTARRQLPAQHLGRPAVGRPGRGAGGFLGLVEAIRQLTGPVALDATMAGARKVGWSAASA